MKRFLYTGRRIVLFDESLGMLGRCSVDFLEFMRF